MRSVIGNETSRFGDGKTVFLLSRLLPERRLRGLGLRLDFQECSEHDKELVDVAPFILVEIFIGCDRVIRCLVFFHELNYSLLESLRLSVHDVEDLHALLDRVLVVVLLDGDIAAADTNHAIFAARLDHFALGSDQV